MDNILKTHLIYAFLPNLTVSSVSETLYSILCPGEVYLKVEAKERALLSEYISLTGFVPFLTTQLLRPDANKVFEKIRELRSDPKVIEFIGKLTLQSRTSDIRCKNLFLNWFHGFFNRKLISKQKKKEPEELYGTILDIDRLKEYIVKHRIFSAFPSSLGNIIGQMKSLKVETSGRRGSIKLVNPLQRMGTVDFDEETEGMYKDPNLHRQLSDSIKYQGHLNNSMVDLPLETEENEEAEDQLMEELALKENQKISADMIASRANFFNLKNFDSISALPKLRVSKGLKSFQKLILATIAGNLLLGRKGFIKEQRQLKLTLQSYPENIRLYHENIRERRRDWNKFFDYCIKGELESKALHNLINQVFLMYHTNATHINMNRKMRVFTVEDPNFRKLFFGDEKCEFLIELFEVFILKIEYALENVIKMQSGYIAGQTFNLIARNIDFFIESKEVKTDLARVLREYISDLCRLINSCHHKYKGIGEDNLQMPGEYVSSR